MIRFRDPEGTAKGTLCMISQELLVLGLYFFHLTIIGPKLYQKIVQRVRVPKKITCLDYFLFCTTRNNGIQDLEIYQVRTNEK